MLTKADFVKAIADSIAAFPVINPLYQAEDPRIIQHMDAMASVLALFSSQIEVSLSEPFLKARDSTILADAAMRGIISKATPARARLKVVNANTEPFDVDNNRMVLDTNGREWRIDTPLTIAAGGTRFVGATQIITASIEHTVSGTYPFYAIQVPANTSGYFYAGIALKDSSGVYYEYRERFVNTLPGEKVFHIETDDRKLMWVRLGYRDVVGVQPRDGEVLTLTLSYTAGDIKPKADSPMSFDYLLTPLDKSVTIFFGELTTAGINPPDMATLRDLCRYPSVYDHSAVYLGEFDFLIRRNHSNLRFLSVWNETVEEAARGASVDNINTLFVACVGQNNEELVLGPGGVAIILKEYQLTTLQKAIRKTILNADNSYRVKFFTPVRTEIAVSIAANVATSYYATAVKSQIIAALLGAFGEDALYSQHGMNQPTYKQIYDLLMQHVPAITPEGRSDANITMANRAGKNYPEYWAYMTANSLSITVTAVNVTNPSWGI